MLERYTNEELQQTFQDQTNPLPLRRMTFLEEMTRYYSEDTSRRAIVDGRCFYYDSTTGKRCAIGRWKTTSTNPSCQWYGLLNEDKAEYPEWLRSLGDGFLRDVQRFHDGDEYWDGEGLNTNGLTARRRIQVKYETLLATEG